MAYDLINSMATSALTQDEDTFFYHTTVPFKVEWNTGQSPVPVPYRMWTDDLSIDQTGTVGGGQQGFPLIHVPINMNGTVALNIEAYHPQHQTQVVASARATETVSELTANLGDYTLTIPIEIADAKSWATGLIDDFNDLVLNALLTPSAMQEFELEHNLSPGEVLTRTTLFSTNFRAFTHWAGDSAINEIYGFESPNFVFRIGSGNPGLPILQDAFADFIPAMNSGATGILAPGESFPDRMADFFEIVPNISGTIDAAANALDTTLATGNLPNLIDTFGEHPMFTRMNVVIPAGYSSQNWSMGGQLQVGLQNVSARRVGGAYWSAGMGFMYQRGGFTAITIAEMNQSFDFQSNTSTNLNASALSQAGWNY